MIKQHQMKNKIYYFSKSIIWPLLLGVGQFLITWILSFYYICKENITLEEIKEPNFQIKFQTFIEQNSWFLIIGNFILLMLIYSIFQKRREKEESIQKSICINSILLGSGLGISLNLIFGQIFGSSYTPISFQMFFLELVTIGIIGPILEEYTYRGLMTQTLKKAFSMKKVILIVTIVFSLSHQGLQNILYALFMGSLFFLLFQKGNINYAIIAHVSANLTTLGIGFLTKGWKTNLLIPLCIILIYILIFIFCQKEKESKM